MQKWRMSPRVQNTIDQRWGFILIKFGLNMIFWVQCT